MSEQNPDMAMVKLQEKAQQAALELQMQKQTSDQEIKMLQEQNRQNRTEFEMMLDRRKQEHKEVVEEVKLEQKSSADRLAQQIEYLKNEMDNQQKQTTELLKNHDDNRTRLLIEQIKTTMTEMKPVEVETDAGRYMQQMEEIIQRAQSAQVNDQLQLIMEGLKETIQSSRAPRTTVAIRDEAGKLVGTRSEL
jgi:hypothetical protein